MQEPLQRAHERQRKTRKLPGWHWCSHFRMLGMFNGFCLCWQTYGMDLEGATPTLIGLAIGAYGLTQALLRKFPSAFFLIVLVAYPSSISVC